MDDGERPSDTMITFLFVSKTRGHVFFLRPQRLHGGKRPINPASRVPMLRHMRLFRPREDLHVICFFFIHVVVLC